MRSFFIASAALFIMGSAPAVAAPEYPWCQQTRNTAGSSDCRFTSFQQCQASISGIGGTCVQNLRLAYGQYRGQRGAQRDVWQRDGWQRDGRQDGNWGGGRW